MQLPSILHAEGPPSSLASPSSLRVCTLTSCSEGAWETARGLNFMWNLWYREALWHNAQNIPPGNCLFQGPRPKTHGVLTIAFALHLVPCVICSSSSQVRLCLLWMMGSLSAPGWWTAPQPSLTRECSSDLQPCHLLEGLFVFWFVCVCS